MKLNAVTFGPARPARTLLLLHGYGADEMDLVPLGPELDRASGVVSLQGPCSLGGGMRAWFHLQQTADGFKEQYDQQSTQVEQLKEALHQLELKIQDASTKEQLLIARSRRAKAETNIRTTLSGMDQSSALASFQRIEEKVNQQEARAAALGELDSDTMEHRFQLMEQESTVENQLAELKAKKGLAAPADDASKALGSGSGESKS